MHALTSLEDLAISPNPIKDLFHVKKKLQKKILFHVKIFLTFAATSAKGQSKARNQ